MTPTSEFALKIQRLMARVSATRAPSPFLRLTQTWGRNIHRELGSGITTDSHVRACATALCGITTGRSRGVMNVCRTTATARVQ